MAKKKAAKPERVWEIGIVGARVRKAREAGGWGQVQMHAKCGIHPTTISLVEGGKKDMTCMGLKRLARGLGVSADYLLGLSDSPKPR